MADPRVEKLKELGIRYGDKAAVVLTSLLFLFCLGAALNKESIQLTPEQVKKSAESADSNIRRRQDPDSILRVLEAGGIKPTDFSKQIEESSKNVLVADNYKPQREWITLEPGAGLLRETPKLIAPSELYAYPGRGGALVYDLDAEGNRILDTETRDLTKDQSRRNRRRRHAGGMTGMMGGRRGRRSQADIEKEQQQEAERKQKAIAAKLAGKLEDPEPIGDEKMSDAASPAKELQQYYKEVTNALHWVVITGVLDHAKLVANYREALKNPAVANPHYARLELERQVRQKDLSWSDWEKVDAQENLKILDNLPEEDEELTPESVRPDNLNDPLPFLKAGLWEKVHIGSLVPREKKEIAPRSTAIGAGGGSSRVTSSVDSRTTGGRIGGGLISTTPTGGDAAAFWRSQERRVMIRALDFTTLPDSTYRYRVRIVVFNPNHNRDDVISTAVDTKSTELLGPWSEPTDEVTMPADISAYALSLLPSAKSETKVNFQVIRFDANTGVTIPHKFAASVGEIIGEVSSADVPTSEGTGKHIEAKDFNTRQIVLDVRGGLQPLPPGFPGGPLEHPALTLLLRPDGSVLVRSQADDLNDEVRKDIQRNYDREVKDSSKRRESSLGSGYPGIGGGGRR
ncbi:MAG: hypothetical protein ACLP7Q_15560 [Isosphaeraceae bacterium]